MAIYRVLISFPHDSAFPRDAVSITPHFSGNNADALADVLVNNIKAIAEVGAARSFTLKVYDAQKAPPNYPLETRVNGTGFSTSAKPREIALCLSYYSTYNRPRYRGRLYIPGQFISGAFDLRPSAAQMTIAKNWGTALSSNMPEGHNWVVYSRMNDEAYGVTDWWVDDEWDIQRSRGLRATTRQVASLP